jgi:hypothetical protein
MTTTETIKTLQRRIDFLQGKMAAGGGSSFERAEVSALEHAIIRMKQITRITEILVDNSSNINRTADGQRFSAEVLNLMRSIETSEGRRLKGPIWKSKENENAKNVHPTFGIEDSPIGALDLQTSNGCQKP